jgi:hypothetical protein
MRDAQASTYLARLIAKFETRSAVVGIIGLG